MEPSAEQKDFLQIGATVMLSWQCCLLLYLMQETIFILLAHFLQPSAWDVFLL